MKVGSFIPEQPASTLYAMAGDDCSLHHDLSSLTPKQQADHQENQVLTCALQVALVVAQEAAPEETKEEIKTDIIVR